MALRDTRGSRHEEEDESPRGRRRSHDDDEDNAKPSRAGRGRGDGDEAGVSLELEDAVDVGLFDAGPATIRESVFAEYDYGGHSKPQVVWLITYERDGEKYEQPYGIGKGWRILKNGEAIKSKAGLVGLPRSCNAVKYLLTSLREAGMSRGTFAGNPRVLEGGDYVLDRVPQERREGLKQSDRERSILIITKIVRAPWDKASGKRSSRSRADGDTDEAPRGKHGAVSREADADVDEETLEALIEALEAAKGELDVEDIGPAVGKVVKGNPQAKAIVARAADDEFLAMEKGWSHNTKKGLVTLD